MTIQVKPSGSALGAEIIGADLTQPLDDATFAQIRAAFYQHEVLYFRGQALSDEDQIRFSTRFGELRKLKLTSQLHVAHPEIFVVSNIIKDYRQCKASCSTSPRPGVRVSKKTSTQQSKPIRKPYTPWCACIR